MALFGWIMMGIALWHFTVFLPDRFWAGIVGAFVGAVLGAVFFSLAVYGFSLPSQDDTTVATVLVAVPGTLLGLAAVYAIGLRQERAAGPDASGHPAG
jgi:hypothetical protein